MVTCMTGRKWVANSELCHENRFRLDLAALVEGDVAGAQEAKVALEERQRHDAKLRKEAHAALQ